MLRLDDLWSAEGENSDIAALNRQAGASPVPLHPVTRLMLARGGEFEEISGGAFNLLMGSVTGLWGFQTDAPRIPDSAEIAANLPFIRGEILFEAGSVTLADSGSKLDIGGIAKGHAVDLAAEMLMRGGMKSFIVEAGGDLRTVGAPGKDRLWRIGIAHPRRPGKLYGVIEVGECAAATSGDYQQFFEREGKRYHHIIDPATGWPGAECVSATVIAGTCVEADALATALFIMGSEKGMEWLKKHPQYQGLIIYFDEAGRLQHVITPQLEKRFKLK